MIHTNYIYINIYNNHQKKKKKIKYNRFEANKSNLIVSTIIFIRIDKY